MDDSEIISRMAKVENRAESNTRRIDKLEQSNDALLKMATSVELLSFQMGQFNTKIGNIEEQISDIKETPSKNHDKLFWIVATAIIGAIVGVIFRYI